MRTGLIAAGANIAVVSLFAVLYGVFSNSSQILGLGLSGVLAGLGLVGVGASPPEGPSTALEEIIGILLNALSAITEELDLNNTRIGITGGEEAKIIISTREASRHIPPGVGVSGGTPYLAIPVGHILEEVSTLQYPEEAVLRNNLSDIIVTHLNIAKLVDIVFLEHGLARISIAGVREEIGGFERRYPLSPLTLLLLVILYRLTGRSIWVRESGRIVDGAYWIVELGE